MSFDSSRRTVRQLVPALALALAMACHGSSTSPTPTPTPNPPAAQFNHVFLLVLENNGFDRVIGSSSMPYLNGLASGYGLATRYYANGHPSIGNYFMLATGDMVTADDKFGSVVSTDNIVRQLLIAGKTWKSYAEDLPAVGYTGPDTGDYARRHNVFALLSDVAGSATQVRNLVPFSQLAADLAGNALPNYGFIVPNLCHDGHNCSLSVADSWLQANIGLLIANQQFQADGLLVITFDEAEDQDVTNGGGHVAWVAVSAKSRRGYQSAVLYQHDSTLRLTAEALGLSVLPNRAATAPSMKEFFY